MISEIEALRVGVQEQVSWLRELGDPVLILAAGAPRTIPEGTPLTTRAFGLRGEPALGSQAEPALGPRGEPQQPAAVREPGVLVAAHFLAGHPAYAVVVGDPAQTSIARSARAVLVMGGGSARRRDGAPGYIDDRAVAYDDELARLIGDADVSTLATPDLALARALLADLPAPLAVAARLVGDNAVHGELVSYDAPYGVANFVARWSTDE